MTKTTAFTVIHEMPTEGQFVMLHEFNSKLWSQTYQWEGDELQLYLADRDEWQVEPDHEEANSAINILGYVVM